MNLSKPDFTKQNISLVEYFVYSYPKGLEGWRGFRIEYGNTNTEGFIWLPPDISPNDVEDVCNSKFNLNVNKL